MLLEIPAGTLDPDPSREDGVEDPALAARRELEEETGYRAESWELLTSFWTAPGFATELMHLYLATGLRPAHGRTVAGPTRTSGSTSFRCPGASRSRWPSRARSTTPSPWSACSGCRGCAGGSSPRSRERALN